MDKPWSQVSSLLPPGMCLQFLSRIGFSIPTSRRLSSNNVANSRSRAFRQSFFYARKSPYEYVHSVRIEPTKLILAGTRITYQATGDIRRAGVGWRQQSRTCRSLRQLHNQVTCRFFSLFGRSPQLAVELDYICAGRRRGMIGSRSVPWYIRHPRGSCTATPLLSPLQRVTKSYLLALGGYPDKLLFHQALN